jgi:LPS sulfotransferase NodH
VADFPEYVERVRDAGTTPNGAFGSKLMRRQLVDLVGRLTGLGGGGRDTALLARYFPSPRFIWMRREDTAAQAVSWSRAIQTGSWHHWDPGKPEAAPVYDRDQITALAREVVEDNAAWEVWFSANGVDPLVVWFDALATDPVPVTREALAFLGVEAAGVTIRPQTVRSADQVNAEWLSRYRTPSSQPNRRSGRG